MGAIGIEAIRLRSDRPFVGSQSGHIAPLTSLRVPWLSASKQASKQAWKGGRFREISHLSHLAATALLAVSGRPSVRRPCRLQTSHCIGSPIRLESGGNNLSPVAQNDSVQASLHHCIIALLCVAFGPHSVPHVWIATCKRTGRCPKTKALRRRPSSERFSIVRTVICKLYNPELAGVSPLARSSSSLLLRRTHRTRCLLYTP